jgi:hypothetical protein
MATWVEKPVDPGETAEDLHRNRRPWRLVRLRSFGATAARLHETMTEVLATFLASAPSKRTSRSTVAENGAKAAFFSSVL